jgi:hypothetical protein
MSSSDDRVARSLQRWWSRQTETDPADWRHGRSVEALAAELRRDVTFELASVRFLHRRPDDGTALGAVLELQPKPAPADAEVLAEAIVRAGGSARTVRMTTAGAVLTVLALVVRNVLRGR